MDNSATEQQKNVLENEYPAWQVYRLLSQIKKKKKIIIHSMHVSASIE